MADDVLQEAPPHFALAGMSLGGIVALKMWRKAPERISHLALLDTTLHPDNEQRRALRQEQIDKAQRGLLLNVLVDSMKPRYLARQHRHDRRLRQAIVDQAMASGPEAFVRQSLALAHREDSNSCLTGID